jgi:hypothetical protein
MPYFETSAKLNKNVDEIIGYMMEQVYLNMFSGNGSENGGRDTNTVVIKNNGSNNGTSEKRRGGCC